jgi:hypothetical protein
MGLLRRVGRLFSAFRLYMLLPALGFLAVSTLALLGGIFWPWGWAVGIVLLFFSGKSSSEKKGYRF